MTKLRFLLYCVFFAILLGSCQDSDSFQESENHSSYMKQMSSQQYKELQRALEVDLAYIDTLLVDAKATRLYVSFGMSFSSGSGSSSGDFDAAEPYQYDIEFDSIAQQLSEAVQDLSLQQTFIHPNSTIVVTNPKIMEGGTISIQIANHYIGNKIIAPESIGLKRIDSVAFDLNYSYPKTFERREIAQNSNLEHGQDLFTIDEWDGNHIEFSLPQTSYAKVLSFQALNTDGKLMNPSSKSTFPVSLIKPVILDQFKITRDLLQQALEQGDTDKAMAFIKQIPKGVFEKKNLIVQMQEDIKQLEELEDQPIDKMITSIENLMEEYAILFSLDVQSVDLTFPSEIEKVYAYMGENYDSIATSGIAINQALIQQPYVSYQDSMTSKHGIIDSLGNIIIEAKYDRLLVPFEGSNYFDSYRKGSYYLDVANRKMIEIKHKTLIKEIDDRRAVFADSMNYHGLLENNKTTLLPFAYDQIDAVGNSYLVKKSLRGRSHFELLDSDGKELLSNLKNATISKSRNLILISTKDRKEAVIDTNGNYKIAPQENTLIFVGNDSVMAYSSSNSLGLIATNGTLLTEEVFYRVFSDSEGLILVQDYRNYLYGYLKPNGTIFIPLNYSDAYEFNLGLALVLDEGGSWHFIDTTGAMASKIPESAGRLINVKDDGQQIRYIFENKIYDAQGKEITG